MKGFLSPRLARAARWNPTLKYLAETSPTRQELPGKEWTERPAAPPWVGAEGIVAGTHKLARVIWALIVSGQPYDEAKAFAITPATTARRLKNLQNQAKALNMTLVPA